VTAFTWPVYAFTGYFRRDRIATFFDYYDAVDFVNASDRNLYIGEPRYDRRTDGYRAVSMTEVERIGPTAVAA
jgi:hypothetical protein